MNKTSLAIKTTWITIFILGVINLVSSNGLATKSLEMGKIEKQIKVLELKNTTLSMQIADSTKFTDLEEKALDNGFEKVSQVVYLAQPVSLASR